MLFLKKNNLALTQKNGEKMIKTVPTLEVKIGEKIFSLHLPIESTYGEIHDALFQMRSFIINKIVEANEMADKHKEKSEEPKEE